MEEVTEYPIIDYKTGWSMKVIELDMWSQCKFQIWSESEVLNWVRVWIPLKVTP